VVLCGCLAGRDQLCTCCVSQGNQPAPQGSQPAMHEVCYSAVMGCTPLLVYCCCLQVRLVIEFCDKGCLRDALDREVFLTNSGLNYAAVLDSAADIARAMLHLHCNNVVHADVSVRHAMRGE